MKKKMKETEKIEKMIRQFRNSTVSLDYFSGIEQREREMYMKRMRNANTYKKAAKTKNASAKNKRSASYSDRSRDSFDEALNEYDGYVA